MAARGIVVEVIGDDRSALRMWERQIAASETTGAAYKKFALTAQETATVQVQAALKAERAQAAQIAGLRALAAASPVGSAEQVKALALADAASVRLARSQGLIVGSTKQFGGAAKEAERDVNKFTRGVLSGSGILGRFERSLAFASTGFIAFATAAEVIKESITSAEDLEKAQRSLDVAIRHTGGNVERLQPLYEGTAKAAAEFGISQATATTGLARATVLTGNAAAAQRAYQEALVISKATGKDFNVALTATSKAQEGITTSLRRYGILVTPTMKGTEQLALVMKRFGGQAAANTTELDKLKANFVNTAAVIGEELLPSFNRIVTSISAWLQKMTESGRLQRDVNDVISGAGDVFHSLGAIIGTVDKVTGSFKNTLELLIGLKFASLVTSWIGALTVLAAKWGLVTSAATAAEGAQIAALRVGAASGTGAAATAARGGTLASLAGNPALIIPLGIAATQQPQVKKAQSDLQKVLGPFKALGESSVDLGHHFINATQAALDVTNNLLGINQKLKLGLGGPILKAPGFENLFGTTRRAGGGPFGTAQPMKQFFQKFELTFREQLAQLQASLTRSSADDVAAARQVVARIKHKIDQGVLHGQALRDALSLEANALSTIWAAEDAAAQKRAAKAQAAKERIQRQIEDSIDPLRLEVSLSQAQALGKPFVGILKQLRAAARKALESGKLTLAQQKEAWDQIASLNQQIKDALTTSTAQFQVPAKLAFRLARDTALGRDTTKDLLAIRKALLRFIATHKHNLAALTDAYNQLADINAQIGATATSALGLFRQASTRALTEGLGLTSEQRRKLRARLSQLGPGGTRPGEGVGAGGFAINPDTGRPIHVHTRIDIDGNKVAENTTRHQQRRRRRNSSQRRGPNAGG